MTLSEFEKQRQANISRNKELFKKLNLGALSRDFHHDIPKAEPENPQKRARTTTKTIKKVKKEPIMPTRRSRRIAGVKLESDEASKFYEEQEEKRKEQEEKDRLRLIRLSGDLNLSDIIKDDHDQLEKLSRLGKSISLGDFYETVKGQATDNKDINKTRDDIEKLELYEHFHPNEIKLTSSRMTSIVFHPSTTKKIVIGGDKMGEMGIWSIQEDIDSERSEPEITHFSFHRNNIANFVIRSEHPQEIVSCSYDGSVRVLDLNKSVSKSVLEFDDAWGDASGISEIKFIDANVCYFTTLQGEFSVCDVRESCKRSNLNVLRLHDKKIGSFAVNPQNNQQIVSASLDRTMRIWDLRTSGPSKWSEYENATSPHCIGSYKSRLSVSTADWNKSNDIVCNGYDDTINIFQLGEQIAEPDHVIKPILEEELWEGIPINLKPFNKLRHNCQTGRWVSILKARWHANPADGAEKFVIANMKKYFDVYNRDGVQLAHLGSDRMNSVPAVCNFHPTENWIVGGNANGKTFLFT